MTSLAYRGTCKHDVQKLLWREGVCTQNADTKSDQRHLQSQVAGRNESGQTCVPALCSVTSSCQSASTRPGSCPPCCAEVACRSFVLGDKCLRSGQGLNCGDL